MRLIFLLCLVALGCQQPQPHKSNSKKNAPTEAENIKEGGQKGLPRGQVLITTDDGKELTIRVEIAHTSRMRQIGLMYRQKLAEFDGMLFLFSEEDQQGFYMKNTYLPLDMIFIKADMTVLGVYEGAVPLTLDDRSVPGESQYVLEVNANFSKRHGIKSGTKVRFVGTDGLPVE